MGIKDQVKAVINNFLALLALRPDTLAIEKYTERTGKIMLPAFIGHLAAIRQEPGDILHAYPFNRLSGKPFPAAEGRMCPTEGDELRGKLHQRPIDLIPMKPRELVILTIGVIVALLRSPGLITGQEHGYTLRKE